MSLRPADGAQPLRFWRTDQLRELERLLEQALLSWARDWGISDTLVRVGCHRAAAHRAAASEGVTLRGEDGILAWFRSQGWSARLVEELFGAAIDPVGIAGEVAAACLDDATRRLADVLGMPAAQPASMTSPPHPAGVWSGEVQASLPWDGVLLLNAAAVDACLRRGGRGTTPRSPVVAPGPAPMPLLQAAAGERVPLQVQLEPCEVDLGILQDLQPGDVLRIPHRLDAPLRVRTESGVTLFNGYLARSRGRKVLELVPSA